MSNLKLGTFPNEPKKLKRRRTGTLKLHKNNDTRGQITDFNCGTISKTPNHDIDCNEETSKINLNLSLNSFEFTFQFPNKLESTKCFEVFSEADPIVVNDDNSVQDTDATNHRVKSIMKNSKIEGESKKTITSETCKKVSFLESLQKETTNSLNDTLTDMGRALTRDANICKKEYPTRKKDDVNLLINKPAIANDVENAISLKDQLNPQSDFSPTSVGKKTSDKNLLPQNSLNDCTIQLSLSQEEKKCSLATNSEFQVIFEPTLNRQEEQSLLQNLFEPGDHPNETQLLKGSSAYSNIEPIDANAPYSKTKLVYDQEIKSLDSAIRGLKIQRKKLAMKRRASKWNSFFWFAMPREENFVRHCDKTTSNKYSDEKVAIDSKTQRKYRSFLSYRSPAKAKR